jgi:hypothetical protein
MIEGKKMEEEIKGKIIKAEDEEEFKHKIEWYKTYRESKLSLIGDIYTALWVTIFLVFVEALEMFFTALGIPAGFIIALKLIILFSAFLIFEKIYISQLKDTYKPIIVSKNTAATLEGEPVVIEEKDGKKWAVCKVKDNIEFEERKKK